MIQGKSGCTIEIKDGKVIKSASSNNYDINRLIAQAKKQRQFSNFDLPSRLCVPTISQEIHSIEMEYVNHVNILQFLIYATKSQVDELVTTLCRFIDYEIQNSSIQTIDGNIILDKYESIEKKCNNIIPILTTGVPGFLTLPIGVCHGDCTLSNILIDTLKNQIVLIDFLDSFIETPLIDIVKLRQSTKHHWECFLSSDDYDQTRIKTMLNYMDEKLVQFFEQFEWYNKYYKLFQFINFCRIIPYSTNSETDDYLLEQIKCLH